MNPTKKQFPVNRAKSGKQTSISWMTGITAMFLLAGVASAQIPIVAVKVTPEESVYRDSAWNKPIVIESQEDAAKHFGKNALATLAKEVDFKKQIVLVFAWQGSGGDQMNYTVAKSLPEQIFFSLAPGRTRDLHAHATVYALRLDVKWRVEGRDKPKEKANGHEKSVVRPVKFVAQDPTVVFMIGGQSKRTRLADAEAVEKTVGKESARSPTEGIDFTKEKLVLVSWTSSGPPEGMLKHWIKGKHADCKITFYIQGPDARIRGQRALIGADFFAVPPTRG